MKLTDLIHFYKPPFRYVRLGDYTGCTSDRIEDADGFVLIELRPDLFPNSEQHDTAHVIASALTAQANAMLKAVATPASILAAEDSGGAVAWLRTIDGEPDWQEDCIYESREQFDGSGYLASEGFSVMPLYAAPSAKLVARPITEEVAQQLCRHYYNSGHKVYAPNLDAMLHAMRTVFPNGVAALPSQAGMREVIEEMITVAAGEYEGAHEDFDPWTADNRAIIDKWQCRIADALCAREVKP